MLTEFKKFDFVYNPNEDEFGIIKRTYGRVAVVDIYNHKGIGPYYLRTDTYFFGSLVKCIGPDNLKNRLAIRIKHGQ
jgi:hypothetical protein